MSRLIFKGIVCSVPQEKSGGPSIEPRKRYLTHPNVPDGANREYLKSQNPAEGGEKRGFGAVKVEVHALPDSSNEQL